MKINYLITIITLFICHSSIAQNDSLNIVNSPFHSHLTKVKDNDTLTLVKFKDSLILWKKIEKIDSTKKWKLIGLKISDSTRYATDRIPQWSTPDNNVFFRVNDTLPTINYDTLNSQFKLDEVDIRKTTDLGQYDRSIDWTSFSYNNMLTIKKCDVHIFQAYDSWTTYEYYFEEIE
jgi:hypothetical protein